MSAFDQIMAEEQRFGEPPGKHPVEDKSPIDACVTGRRRGDVDCGGLPPLENARPD
jgi:hypothetical protein